MEITLEQLNTFLLIWIGVALVTFISLFFVKAPFGRHVSDKFGVMINNSWGWVFMEFPSMFFILFWYIMGDGNKNIVTHILVGMWVIHYINRTFIFPFRLRNKKKKMPLLIVLSAVFFNFFNAGTNGYFFGNFADYTVDYLYSPVFIIGFAIWALGWVINLWADEKLLNLRKPGETHYVIPNGGLFNKIASPNLFGEIIEWIGFAIAAGSLAAWGFAIWTMANLIPRAKNHFDWYKEKFKEYPKDRKVLIPKIW